MHRSIVQAAAKAPAIGCVGALAAIGIGVWLLTADRSAGKAAESARTQRALLEERIAQARERIEQLEVELPPEQERALRAEKLVAELKDLTSTWSWFRGNREQQRLNRERLEKMETLQADAAARAAALQQELQRLRWGLDAQIAERERAETAIAAEEAERASGWFWVRRGWQVVRGWIVVGVGVYLLGAVAGVAGVRHWRARRAAAV